eukprot:TRINITY_DN15786_c0_g1_i1.p1 TRINITY_DN15786_c0_g1~~TRINITY_DN15786_c0_g1_i1.p1  ORF type:complete len:424 (+),score=105.21 TRINITY_DN15786_c0_g1_i1:47-1318(+)
MERDDTPTTPSLHVISFLQKNEFDVLRTKHRINYHYHPDFPNLVQLRYEQRGCKFNSMIVRECRGLILDRDKNWKVVAWPYAKFFNAKEKEADKIDWKTAKVFEKVDGSLATLYWYNGWHVASSSIPDGSAELNKQWTFKALFWDIWKKLKYRLPDDKTKCYMFEMLTDRNVILVRPKREALILHGVRNMINLQEEEPEEIAQKYGWECIQSYPMTTLEEVMKVCNQLNPMESEGFIVRDAQFKRIKIKSPQYVALSYLTVRDTKKMNGKNMLQIVRTNEGSEFLSYFPMYKELYLYTKRRYDQMTQRLDNLWMELEKYREMETFDDVVDERLKSPNDRKLLKMMAQSPFNVVSDFLAEYDLSELLMMVEMNKLEQVTAKSAAVIENKKSEDKDNEEEGEEKKRETSSISSKKTNKKLSLIHI